MNGSNSSGGDTITSGSSSVARSKYKNAPGNKTDIGWEHGIDVDGNVKKVKCKYCSKIASGGVFRFKRHLVGTRKDSEPYATVSDEIKLLMMKIVVESKARKEKKRRLNSIDEDEEIDTQVAEFFYTSVIPFNAIKNLAFFKMCEMIGKYRPSYKPPSYHGVKEKLLKLAVQKTDDSLQEFRNEWKRTDCSIISNGPKGTIFLYSLDTSDMSKITDKVFKMLDGVVTFVGEENVVQVITDNATNFKVVRELLMHTWLNLYLTPCVVHCIGLILEDLEKHLKIHEVTIKKGRKITTYIYGRTMFINMLKKYTNGRDLVRPGMTKFEIAYLTLACLHEMKTSLMRLFNFKEWKKSKFGTSQEEGKVENSVLDSRFWKNVSICLKVVAPLMVVLRLVDSDQQPAMGFIYVEMDHAKEMIKNNFNNVKKRWKNQLYRHLHAVAYYLNPQLHFEDDFKKDNGEFAIRVLSLTCSSYGCERNWSSFEMVHTKRRNRLHKKKMNDLVYVMYNLKLKSRQTRKIIVL
uniref:BED-type domain-containing protein n=1 Tax=Glycine max TaxID=3847 RepID=A0A0R0LB65_SOYBN